MPVVGDATDYMNSNLMSHESGDPNEGVPTRSRMDPAAWAAAEILLALGILWLLGYRLNGLT